MSSPSIETKDFIKLHRPTLVSVATTLAKAYNGMMKYHEEVNKLIESLAARYDTEQQQSIATAHEALNRVLTLVSDKIVNECTANSYSFRLSKDTRMFSGFEFFPAAFTDSQSSIGGTSSTTTDSSQQSGGSNSKLTPILQQQGSSTSTTTTTQPPQQQGGVSSTSVNDQSDATNNLLELLHLVSPSSQRKGKLPDNLPKF